MKLVKTEPSKKICKSCKSQSVEKRTYHYSVRGQCRGTKGVMIDYKCSCGFEFFGSGRYG